VHEHNGPVVGVILSGTAIVQIDGQPEVVLGPGEPFSEPERTRILRFDAGPQGLEFVAFFPVGPGEEPTLTPLDD
jgi:quercetin dioxygenase-like cupin family protein